MSESEIEALGQIGLEVSDMAAWLAFGEAVLGLSAHPHQTDGAIDLRMDAYAARVRLREGPADDLDYLGWEVRDAAALERLTARLQRSGVEVEVAGPQACGDRGVAGLVRFSDPEGIRSEAYFGPLQRADAPFVSPIGVRFKTGAQGLGHAVLRCANKAAMEAFYTGVLGLRVSDHIRAEVAPGRPVDLTFLRCNGRHHSLALASAPTPRRLAHLMVEVSDLDDVGRALERCEDRGTHISMTLGRHSNDEMLSFYALTPSGFDVEYGWGGLEVDDQTWHVLTHDRISAWGHRFRRPPRPEVARP